ncbi:MAG: prevent-host-death protein [Patescibacteria group bacterium]
MYDLTVGQFKSKFSEVLEKVLQGQSIGITYGKNKKKVAALVPYHKYMPDKKIKLGILEGKASFKIQKGFKMTEEEFLGS